jgi:hypothetical protein
VDPKITGLIAVGVVVVIAMLLRGASKPEPTGTIPLEGPMSEGAVPPTEAIDGEDDARAGSDGDDEGDDAGAEVVAVTSDGYALVPDVHAVRLVPPHEEGEAWKTGETARNLRGERALAMSWNAGDFTGARVVRGAADEGPWRFEALGRDGEYTAFVFETREGADAALALFESRGVVRHGRDEDEREAPPSAEQFEESRRIYLETEAALELTDEDES